MRATMILKRSLVAIMCVFACGMSAFADNEDDFIHNDVVVDGLMQSREVFRKSSSGTLTPVNKYEFAYDENSELTQKTCYAWNSNKNRWEEKSQMNISRNGNEVTHEHRVWQKNSKEFVPTEKTVYITDTDKNMTTQLHYKMDRKSNWVLQKNA